MENQQQKTSSNFVPLDDLIVGFMIGSFITALVTWSMIFVVYTFASFFLALVVVTVRINYFGHSVKEVLAPNKEYAYAGMFFAYVASEHIRHNDIIFVCAVVTFIYVFVIMIYNTATGKYTSSEGE